MITIFGHFDCKPATMHTATKCFLLVSLIGLSNAGANEQPRIIDGELADIVDYPYQVELQTALLGLFWKFSCGGTIVGPNQVITSANCVYNVKPENIRVLSGSNLQGQGNVHKGVNVTIHPNYTEYFDNDIALVTIDPQFLFHAGVKPIVLAKFEPLVGRNATVTGWGNTDPDADSPSDQLRKGTVPIVDRTLCADSYREVGNVTEMMLCAGFLEGGVDSCKGDTGGPLQIDDVLIGLVSWGYGCGRAGYPAVYTNVAKFTPWVNALLDEANNRG